MLRAGIYFFDHIFFENGSGSNKLAIFFSTIGVEKIELFFYDLNFFLNIRIASLAR